MRHGKCGVEPFKSEVPCPMSEKCKLVLISSPPFLMKLLTFMAPLSESTPLLTKEKQSTPIPKTTQHQVPVRL